MPPVGMMGRITPLSSWRGVASGAVRKDFADRGTGAIIPAVVFETLRFAFAAALIGLVCGVARVV